MIGVTGYHFAGANKLFGIKDKITAFGIWVPMGNVVEAITATVCHGVGDERGQQKIILDLGQVEKLGELLIQLARRWKVDLR